MSVTPRLAVSRLVSASRVPLFERPVRARNPSRLFTPRPYCAAGPISIRHEAHAETAPEPSVVNVDAGDHAAENTTHASYPGLNLLPTSCPGCGAGSQWVLPTEAGYYSPSRKLVKDYIRHHSEARDQDDSTKENDLVSRKSVANAEYSEIEPNPQPVTKLPKRSKKAPHPPLCDRCHTIMHHNVTPDPVPSPPLSHIKDMLDESPYIYNHVYHIIDAADFPLSVIPNIYEELGLQQQRSQNRRSRRAEFSGGSRKPVISFIVSRSDLLAARKEDVDRLMPYVERVLRNTLMIDSEKVRLGNIHMVSAKRGWWTTSIKNKISQHGGGVWMVGKTNVGKSSLMSVIFPKAPDPKSKIGAESKEQPPPAAIDEGESLLPPARPKEQHPDFPLVSTTPGTTASPIRIPLNHKKGEVIDLPGLFRETLDGYVQNFAKSTLVMTKRVKPTLTTVKPNQSLLLGGLIRVTPENCDSLYQISPFVPLTQHTTSTRKAIAKHEQEQNIPGRVIANNKVKESIKSAGVFTLNWDVTQEYASNQIAKFGDSLPYKVMSTEILIEGCGWIEIICQARKRRLEEGYLPKVEVFSPEGKYIASRMPMSAYRFILEKKQIDARKRKSRPRKSMRRVRLTSKGRQK